MAQSTSVTESYIVRIYRRGEATDGGIAGLVELPGQDTRIAFRSYRELQEILEAGARTPTRSSEDLKAPAAASEFGNGTPQKKDETRDLEPVQKETEQA